MDIQMSTANETQANKRARKHNAVVLPEGITQQMMRQYVYYCSEYYDKSHTIYHIFQIFQFILIEIFFTINLHVTLKSYIHFMKTYHVFATFQFR